MAYKITSNLQYFNIFVSSNYQQKANYNQSLDSKIKNIVNIIIQKMEYYCSYQERCHYEVQEKLRTFTLTTYEKDAIIVHLIENNYLSEERFASVFTISKFHQKKWGKIRLTNELKARKISAFLIAKAIKEIPSEEYYDAFTKLSEHQWEVFIEKDKIKKRKKFCDYLLRKGWESDLIYSKAKELENL